MVVYARANGPISLGTALGWCVFPFVIPDAAKIAVAALLLRPYYLNISFGISDYLRDRGLTTPEDIVRVDDQRYGDDAMQVFDVYYPRGTDAPLPTIVSIHGGGYTYGRRRPINTTA